MLSFYVLCWRTLQAVHKATRAAQFKVDASYDKPQHNTLLACDCEVLVSELRQTVGPPDSMQYPENTLWGGHNVPHDRYTNDMAQAAYNVAKKIVENCEKFISD